MSPVSLKFFKMLEKPIALEPCLMCTVLSKPTVIQVWLFLIPFKISYSVVSGFYEGYFILDIK